MKETIFNVCHKQRFLGLVQTEVSRQDYHFLSTQVFGRSMQGVSGFLSLEAKEPYIQGSY